MSKRESGMEVCRASSKIFLPLHPVGGKNSQKQSIQGWGNILVGMVELYGEDLICRRVENSGYFMIYCDTRILSPVYVLCL